MKPNTTVMTSLKCRMNGVNHKLMLCVLIPLLFTVFASNSVFAQASIYDRHGEPIRLNDDVAQSVAVVDSLALVALYNSMKGDTWQINDGWLVDQVAFWHGVNRIDEIELPDGSTEFRVTRLDMFPNDNNMTECGFLTPELLDMEYLERLIIARQFLCGEIPEEIFSLEFLTHFRVRANFVSGQIPWDAIGSAPSLEILSLEQNELEGPAMTSAIGNSQRLSRITLDENVRLTGSFPVELTQIETLLRFGADGLININGPIPDFSGNPNFERIEVQYSNFDPGPFPAWLQQLGGPEGVSVVALQQTNIQGEVPQWIVELSNVTELKLGGDGMGMDMANFPNLSLMPALIHFRLWGGDFTGELPLWFGDTDLERLWISHTDIGGELPGSVFQNLTTLTLLKLRHNQFTGTLPAQLQSITGLDIMGIEYNNMEIGEIPSFIGDNLTGLSKLYLGGNGLTGTIPSNLANLESLTHIRLQDNPELGGSLPGWIWERDLNALDISYTGIDVGGQIPSEIQNHPRMQKLGLAGLGISGQIPSWLGDMPFIRTDGTRDWHPYLSLADNDLSGSIPLNFGNFSTLDSLNLANNNLEGDIDMFATIGSPNEGVYLLGAFDISGNPGLSGEIPADMMKFYRMRYFHVDDTNVCKPDGFDTYLAQVLENGGRSAYTNRMPGGASVTDPASIPICTSIVDDNPGIHSSPAIQDGVIYFGSRDHHLYALNVEDGTEVWRAEAGAWFDASPALTSELVIAANYDHHVYAFDRLSGEKVWKFQGEGPILSSPSIAGDTVFFGSWRRVFHALEVTSGTEKWRYSTQGNLMSSPAVGRRTVFFGCDRNFLYAVTGE